MIESDPIVLHVRYDQRDLSAFLRRSHAHDPTRRTYPAMAAALLVVIPGAAGAVWFVGGALTAAGMLRIVLPGLGSLLAVWGSLYAYRRWMYRGSWMQSAAFNESQELGFGPDGILSRQKHREWLLPWRDVSDVESTPTHIELSVAPWGGVPRDPVRVPRHVFPSFEDSEAFAERVCGFRDVALQRPLPREEVAPVLPPDEPVFTLQDDTDFADYLAGDGRAHWEWDTGIFLAVVAALMLSFPLAALREQAPKVWWVVLGSAALFVGIVWRHVSRGPLPSGGRDPGVMWISREGIVRRSTVTGGWGRTSWGWVHELKVEAKRIVLVGPEGQMMVLPNRIFGDPYQESAFVEAANQWIDAHCATETARAGI